MALGMSVLLTKKPLKSKKKEKVGRTSKKLSFKLKKNEE
jgi:hypothetical protein